MRAVLRAALGVEHCAWEAMAQHGGTMLPMVESGCRVEELSAELCEARDDCAARAPYRRPQRWRPSSCERAK
jgi:hypothetical protein